MAKKVQKKYTRRAILRASVGGAAVGTVGGAVGGAIGIHKLNKYIKSRTQQITAEAQQIADNNVNGMKRLDKENTQVLFEQKNGRSRFAIKDNQPTGEMGYASHDMNPNTHIEFNSEGDFRLDVTDRNDPNKLDISIKGDKNGGTLKYKSINGKYIDTTLLNGDPNELKSLPGYKK